MSETYDVIIVGAGIVGCSCAYQCAENGLKTLLIDGGPIGGQTTAAGMGHIVLLDDSESQFALCDYSRRLWADFAEKFQDVIEWEQRGTLWVAADDDEMQIVRDKHAYYTKKNIRTEVLDEQSVAQEEPNLRKGLCGGLLMTEDAVLYPPSAAKQLADIAVACGAKMLLYKEVKEIHPEGAVILNDGSRKIANIIINAAGHRAPELTKGCNIFKRKGHLLVTNRYPTLVRHQIVELGYLKSAHTMKGSSVAFNIQPRKEGKLLIGSSRQMDSEDSVVDHVLLGRMLDRAFEYIPSLRDISILRTWTGFRPATPDKLPLIGPCPGNEKVWLAAGHEGLGITTSLATGRLVADMIIGRDSEIPIEPYLPSRCAKEAS